MHLIASVSACRRVRSNLFAILHLDVKAHGFLFAGIPETMLVEGPLPFCAEIASMSIASNLPRNDKFFN